MISGACIGADGAFRAALFSVVARMCITASETENLRSILQGSRQHESAVGGDRTRLCGCVLCMVVLTWLRDSIVSCSGIY